MRAKSSSLRHPLHPTSDCDTRKSGIEIGIASPPAILMGMKIKTFNPPGAPPVVGPYSHVVCAGGFCFCSGQIPLDPKTGDVVAGGIDAQTTQVMENISTILSSVGLEFSRVVKTTIYLVALQDFAIVNQIYSRYFSNHLPARSTVQVAALPKGVRIEIEVLAMFAEL